MMARGHLLSGALVGLGTAPLLPWCHTPLGFGVHMVAATYGGLVPDLDMPGAKLSRIGWPVTWVLAHGLQALAVLTFEATRTERDPEYSDGHRGLTHTLVFPAVFGALLLGVLRGFGTPADLALWITVGITLGSWAHIAGDCCTLSGCPLFWPVVVAGRRWYRTGIPRPLRFRTGASLDDEDLTWWQAIGERVVTSALWVGLALVAFSYVPGGYDWTFSVIADAAGWSTRWMV